MSDNEDTDPLACAYCGNTDDLDSDDPTELDDGDTVACGECGEENRMWSGVLVDENEYHESYCESKAASHADDYAHGHEGGDFSPESFRPEW